MGPTKKDCKKLLPPNSYIHVDEYARPIDVARYLEYLNKTWDENIFNFHQWRRHFEIVNEHGYFGSKSVHYCRMCEGLNYNSLGTEVYGKSQLDYYLSPHESCINSKGESIVENLYTAALKKRVKG